MKKITRQQTEDIIQNYCEKIRFIYEQYEPKSMHLSLFITDHSISFNNKYWDPIKPINRYVSDDEEGDTDEA